MQSKSEVKKSRHGDLPGMTRLMIDDQASLALDAKTATTDQVHSVRLCVSVRARRVEVQSSTNDAVVSRSAIEQPSASTRKRLHWSAVQFVCQSKCLHVVIAGILECMMA
jgi:hypothetical protein